MGPVLGPHNPLANRLPPGGASSAKRAPENHQVTAPWPQPRAAFPVLVALLPVLFLLLWVDLPLAANQP